MIRSGSTHQSQKYRVVQGGSIQDRWLLLEFLFWIQKHLQTPPNHGWSLGLQPRDRLHVYTRKWAFHLIPCRARYLITTCKYRLTSRFHLFQGRHDYDYRNPTAPLATKPPLKQRGTGIYSGRQRPSPRTPSRPPCTHDSHHPWHSSRDGVTCSIALTTLRGQIHRLSCTT